MPRLAGRLPPGWGWWAIFGAIIVAVAIALYPPLGDPSFLGFRPVQWGGVAIFVLGGVILLTRGVGRIRERMPRAFGPPGSG